MDGTWEDKIVLSDTSNNVSEDGDGSLDTSGPRYVYFTIDSNEALYIGEELPSSAIVYDSYQEAMDSWGIDFCTKLKIDNNIITEGYIVFKYNNTLYTVKGGTQGASYQSNADVFRSAFGDSNCTEDESFHCNTTDNFGVSMNFFGDDFIINKNNTQNCFIQDDNLIGCSLYW